MATSLCEKDDLTGKSMKKIGFWCEERKKEEENERK